MGAVRSRSLGLFLAMVAVVVAVVVVGGWLAFRTAAHALFPDQCDQADERTAARLEREDVLAVVPPGVEGQARFTTMPCRDDDNVGAVGRDFLASGEYAEIETFYQQAFAERGWRLREQETVPSGNSDVGFCFEHPDFTNVVAVVRFSAEVPYHYMVMFRFRQVEYTCAPT
ncbi:hypothetical protein [Actinokineospora terrae]|uniref:Uncharacterized protein n=1 Tax=Actinokineospora terrae TaxID=155974 RepID=A0A1H9TB02_9PSEU|nr:hypothetical protein [Actinokineospora terrae]SER94435.1 hypothetical protein SAMN04487818_106172 [Actinokineospora terrae]